MSTPAHSSSLDREDGSSDHEDATSDHEEGAFEREDSIFREWVTADGSSDFPVQAGRYHLYVARACPWAHRTLIGRRLNADYFNRFGGHGCDALSACTNSSTC